MFPKRAPVIEKWQILTVVDGIEIKCETYNLASSHVVEKLIKLRYSPDKSLGTEYFMVPVKSNQ